MFNPFVIAARELVKRKSNITRAVWLRSCIASLPINPETRPYCAPNYASDLGVRFRNDPKLLLSDTLDSIGSSYVYYEDQFSPDAFYSSWKEEGSNGKSLQAHLDVLINYAGAWDLAASVSKLYVNERGADGEVGLLTYMAAALNRVDSKLAGTLYESITSSGEIYPTNKVATAIRNAARLIKIDQDLNRASYIIDSAEGQSKEAYELCLISLGDSCVYQAVVMNIRALLYSKQGKHEEALKTLIEARRLVNKADGLVTLDNDQRFRYCEQIVINTIQLLMILDRNQEAREIAVGHCEWVKEHHPSSLSEALHVVGYANYRCNMLDAAILNWEHAAALSACFGRITPLNALRKNLSHAYYKQGAKSKSKKFLEEITSDRSGIKLALSSTDIKVL